MVLLDVASVTSMEANVATSDGNTVIVLSLKHPSVEVTLTV